MCRVFFCVVGRGCLLWLVTSLDQTLLAFALLHSLLQGQICLLLQVFLDFLLLHSSPLYWKGHLFWILAYIKSDNTCREHFAVAVQSLSWVQLFATPWSAAHQISLPFTISLSLFKLMSISQWYHPTISSSVVPFSFCPQSFTVLGSFPKSQLFASGSQSIEASASASVLPMNI